MAVALRTSRSAALAGGLALTLGLAAAGSTDSLASRRAAGGAGAVLGSPPADGLGPVALHVIPFPGTPDASQTSEIILESLPMGDVRSLTVLGSQSGQHAGRLEQLPDSAGTAFTPAQPFDSGERVSVRVRLRSQRAGSVLGDPGHSAVSFAFRVQVVQLRHTGTASAAEEASAVPTRSFRSAPALHPPAVKVGADPDRSSGDLLLTPGGPSGSGLMILNPQGKLVWFRPVAQSAANLQVQRYHSHAVLTWWQGVLFWGEDVIVNHSYRTVAIVRGAEGYVPDQHEFQITPRGTALVDAFMPVRANLTSVGGPKNGTVADFLIQELDIRTGQVLWEWHVLGHVPLTASHVGKPRGSRLYDPYHLNSIQELPGGDLLISLRNTWAVYKIDRTTGHVIWSLGGKRSSFRMGPGTRFEWQHDARLGHDRLSLFDDGDSPQREPQSSAKVFRFSSARRSVTLLRRYTHSPPLLAPLAGSTEILPDHNVFVGWGGEPDFSEYAPGGQQIFAGTFPLGVDSYRAFRAPWSGQPRTWPAIALSTAPHGGLRVYASWNGATRVAAWRLEGGPAQGGLRVLGRWPATGFETGMTLRGRPRYVKAQALDHAGNRLGSSAVHASPAR